MNSRSLTNRSWLDTAIVLVVPLLLGVIGNVWADSETVSGRSDGLEFHRRLVDEFVNIDPGENGWESESFSEAVSIEMKSIAKLLVHPDGLAAKELEVRLADGFINGPLRFTNLETINEGGSMRISRPVTDSEKTKKSVQRGVEGFTEALNYLANVLKNASERRAKFKVMHVEVKGDLILTKMLFEMHGKTTKGRTQVTSTWHCQWVLADPPKLHSIRVSDYREVAPGKNGVIEFIDVAPALLSDVASYREQLAMSFDYWRARSDKSLVADLLGAQGVIVGDVNGDKLDDVYILQPGGLPNRLLIHQVDGTARDASTESGVDILDFCRSALLIDLDNDGDQDLAIGLAWKLFLMENDGKGHFTPRGGFRSEGQVNSMAAADYDNDGDLDIYVCGRDASGAIKAEQGALGIPMPYYDANNGGPNTLFQNDGDFIFNDVTKAVGMDVNNQRFSLACAWEDFDNDGDQDIYVANDFGRKNLFRNDELEPGRHVFVDIAKQAKVLDIGPGMSAAWGDYNNDGHPDLYVANMWSNAGNRITLQKQFLPGADKATRAQARRHARGNSVYLNAGDGTFFDKTQSSGANMARWAWSSNFIDLDNDGRQDLVVANGMISAGDSGDL
jgi:hypothetical protein